MANPPPVRVFNQQTNKQGWWSAAGGFVADPDSKAPGAKYLEETPYRELTGPAASNFNNWRKEYDKAYKAAGESVTAADQMENLMRKQKTGGIYSVPVVGDIAGMFDPEIRGMEGLSNAAARGQRVAGEGTISDFDARMFQTMVFSKRLPDQTNKAIIQGQRLAAENVQQFREFVDWYVQKKGTTQGSPEAFKIYSRANPIFDQKAWESSKSLQLNPSRLSWREYYGGVRGPEDKRPGKGMSDAMRARGMDETGRSFVPDVVNAAYQKRVKAGLVDPKAPQGSARNFYVARDKGELSRLEAMAAKQGGAIYVMDPDGNYGVVK